MLGALVLGRKLAGVTQAGERVGLLLPNVQGMAVTLFGLFAYGRVPALLNFTAGVKNLKAAAELAELKTIVTSRRFIDQAKLDDELAASGEGGGSSISKMSASRSPASTRRWGAAEPRAGAGASRL
jgi:acyl-[acyl-carrier-protein]-phospholipid O-acyltransferase/long-chain-fatty-acid--[acyl-carrier-protein] ligase